MPDEERVRAWGGCGWAAQSLARALLAVGGKASRSELRGSPMPMGSPWVRRPRRAAGCARVPVVLYS